MKSPSLLLTTWLSLTLLTLTANAQICPEKLITSLSQEATCIEAPNICDPSNVFDCQTGSLSTVIRIRPGNRNLFCGICQGVIESMPDPKAAKIEEANRRGITYAQVMIEAQADTAYAKTVVPPLQFQQGPFARAMAKSNKDLTPPKQISPELKKMALTEGINEEVLNRAYELFKSEFKKKSTSRNCFMASDLTTPKKGKVWTLCLNPAKIITTTTDIGSGFGPGCRDDWFDNQLTCARYFGNLPDSCLSMGGPYITTQATVWGDVKRISVGLTGLSDENSNVTRRSISIQRAVSAKDGKTPLVTSEGQSRSTGNFVLPAELDSFSETDLSSDNSGGGITFYVYPERKDIKALVEGSKKTYWNEQCIKEIKVPAWVGEKGDYVIDQESTWADQVEYINRYKQERSDQVTPDKPKNNIR